MEFLSGEVTRLRDLPGHEDKERSGDPDTEQGANEFLDEHRVPQLFEVRLFVFNTSSFC